MDILIVNYEFPPIGGGAGNASRFTARELVRTCGERVTVLTSAFRGLPRRETQDGFRIIRIPTLRRRAYRCSLLEMAVFAVSLCVFGLWHAMRRRPDVIVIYNGMPCGHIGPLCKWFLRIPYVVFLRGGEVPGSGAGLPPFMHRLVHPATWVIWKCAAAVLANGEHLAGLARKAVRGIGIGVIANGVDMEYFHPAAGPSPGADGELRLAYTGRVVKEKGLAELVDALEMAAPRVPTRLFLTVIGDGPEIPALRARSDRLSEKVTVRFTGWVAKEEVARELRESDVYATASYEEGVSNSVLEAMASGLPVIASDIEGHREVVRDGVNGFLCRDVPAIADAVVSLCDDECRARLRDGALAAARAVSWAEVARKLAAVAGSACGRPTNHEAD